MMHFDLIPGQHPRGATRILRHAQFDFKGLASNIDRSQPPKIRACRDNPQ